MKLCLTRSTCGALLAAALLVAPAAFADEAKHPHADLPGVKTQGEYAGAMLRDGEEKAYGIQVIALGNDEFEAVVYQGGLPGAGWDGEQPDRYKGKKTDDAEAYFTSDYANGAINDGKLTITSPDGKELGVLPRVVRKSPTLGAEAPEGSKVLFALGGENDFPGSRVMEGLGMREGANSATELKDHKLHLEFCLPFEPEKRGQGRGNSGAYLQGRYEVQILDSFGLKGENNECGGIYQISAPKVNMCLPPLQWQTYDIDFTAPKFDADGKQTAAARITVRHNGEVIQDDVELPKPTPGGPGGKTPDSGPLHLQNHGNIVLFRNIWAVEK